MQEVRIDMSVLLSCLKEFLLIDRYLTYKIIQLYYSLISSLKQIITYNFDIPICLWLISKKTIPYKETVIMLFCTLLFFSLIWLIPLNTQSIYLPTISIFLHFFFKWDEKFLKIKTWSTFLPCSVIDLFFSYLLIVSISSLCLASDKLSLITCCFVLNFAMTMNLGYQNCQK